MAVGRSQWKREWWWRLSSERCDGVESRSEHSAQQLSSVDTEESGRVSRDCAVHQEKKLSMGSHRFGHD